MASMVGRQIPRFLGALGGLAFMAGMAAAHAESDRTRSTELIGSWRGTSLCTDRIAAPACNDETVVYELTAGPKSGVVHWAADKIVNGQRQRMGEMDLAYDKEEACWKAEFTSPRFRTVWRLVVSGTQLSGTARLLPGNATIRKVNLRKE